jgi:predicted DNA-binding transcriptional regulator AlpA
MTAVAPIEKRDPDDYQIGSTEAARLIGCHVVSIRRHFIHRSDFPRPYRMGGNKLSFWRSEIIDFIESRRGQPHARKVKAQKARGKR